MIFFNGKPQFSYMPTLVLSSGIGYFVRGVRCTDKINGAALKNDDAEPKGSPVDTQGTSCDFFNAFTALR